MDFIKKIKILINEKIKNNKVVKNVLNRGVNFKSSTTKRAVGANYTMEFTTQTKQKIQEIEVQVKDIVKRYFKLPEDLIKYLETYDVEVYRLKNADKILNKLNEEEGFIIPQKGFKACALTNILNLAQGKKPQFKFKTNAMFVFDVKDVEIYTVARALYKYFGYKNNLPGYELKAQEAYKKSKSRKNDIFKGFSPQEIFACKEALSRDMESVNFTINLSVEYANSKKAAQKITDDGANI